MAQIAVKIYEHHGLDSMQHTTQPTTSGLRLILYKRNL